MKNISIFIGFIFVVFVCGCDSKNKSNITIDTSSIDSLINKAKQNTEVVKEASKQGAEMINSKVDKAAQKIQSLETQVKVLKTQNDVLKNKIDNADDDGQPYGDLPISPY